jgi:sporulation protein YlmC with PRC-barrel domain
MKRLRWYQVAASDARVGLVEDLYFDAEDWDIRYLVVEKGVLLWRRSYVVPALALVSAEPHERRLQLRLSKEQVDRCSQTDVGQALSRRARHKRQRTASQVAGNSRLRSAKQLIGHRVQAIDGAIGHVADVLVDAEPRRVPRLVVATGKWPPSRQVTVPTEFVQGINGANRRVFLDISRKAVRSAPKYDGVEETL